MGALAGWRATSKLHVDYRTMPLEYAQDDAKRRIRITLTDPFTVADMIGSVERQLADGGWRYGSLVDARAQTVPVKVSDIRLFTSRVSELVVAHGPRGPIALIARDAGTIGGAQMHAVLAGKNETLEVFWDLDDGQRWLDERLPQTQETPHSGRGSSSAWRRPDER